MTRILIVDDEPLMRQALRSLLQGSGFQVVEAGEGKAALAEVARHAPDLVITDLEMPGVEGNEMIMQLKRSSPDIPIIVLTGSTHAETGRYLKAAMLLGADRSFMKPFDSVQLLAAIRELAAR